MQAPRLVYVPPKRLNSSTSLPSIQSKRKREETQETYYTSTSKKRRTYDARTILEMYAAAPVPSEDRLLSEELAKLTIACERIMQLPMHGAEAVEIAELAWKNDTRLMKFWLLYRPALSNEHRLALWITRLRCIFLASSHCLDHFLSENTGESSSSTTTTTTATMHAIHSSQTKPMRQARHNAFEMRFNTREDRELNLANSVLWPYDTSDSRLFRWCTRNELLPPDLHNVDDDVRNASMIMTWKLVTLLLQRWMHVSYSSFLIAYVWRIVERVAELSAYSGSLREFNHPHFSQSKANPTAENNYDSDEYCINDRFLHETECTFYAIQLRLFRCSFLTWPPPRAPRVNSKEKRAELLMPEALDRLNNFVTQEINHGRFTQYIEKQFEVVFLDHVLFPGEMERFEKLRPHDDRKPLTCLSRMRRNYYDLYTRLFLEPPIRTVWEYLLRNEMYTHPAYMVIVSRVIQFYFDANFDGASFDAYFLAIDKIPLDHLESSVSNALRTPSHGTSAVLTRGSARHTLCGTFLKHGLECTKESLVAHPLIVMCVGTPCLVLGDQCVVIKQKKTDVPHFGLVFLTWLREFCADERLAGTLANGQSVLPLLELLNPTEDSLDVVKRATKIRKKLEDERVALTGLEDEVRLLQHFIPRQSDSNVLVL